MNKKIIAAVSLVFLLFAVLVFGVYISYAIIAPAKKTIDEGLVKYFAGTVNVPTEQISPPTKTFGEISYSWKMITAQNEITGLKFYFTPSYLPGKTKITAVLEKPENEDASLFVKVLPVIVSDEKSLEVIERPEKLNPVPPNGSVYESFNLYLTPKTNQAVKIEWVFEKETLPDDIKSAYHTLGKFPEKLLRIFFGVPTFVISLFKG